MDVYIYDAVRTPRGRAGRGGALRHITPVELLKTVLVALRDRNALDTSMLDDVMIGCVEAIGEQGSDIARTALLMADYDQSVPGVQINRYCASGMDACNLAAAQVAAGMCDLVVAGGVESLSRIPILAAGGAIHSDPAVATKTGFVPQGIGADALATLFGFTRGDVDSFAHLSQQKAAWAWQQGYFTRSVVPVIDENGLTVLDKDEHLRPETTMQSLAALSPAFERAGSEDGFDAIMLKRYPQLERINHVHHAGNSSGMVDGASAVLLGSKRAGQKAGLKPRARILAYASIGSEPTLMLSGTPGATQRVLDRTGMTTADIDLVEVNEAFAAVPLHFMETMGFDSGSVNANGGAIAMGHPLGATGAMLIGTIVDQMERKDLATGLVTVCVGAGMGTATIIERV
ncbi:acetyl-CoA C-acetyltransferase [Bradyrhizobium manausense]